MKRFATLAATFALSIPCVADAEEPQPNPARPKIVVERPKAEPAAPKPAPQVQGAQAGATLPIATVPNQAAVAVTQVTSSGAPGGTVEIQIREAANAAEFAKANAELQQKHAEIQRKHAELQQKVAESQHNAQAQQEAAQRRLEVIVKQQHAAHRAGMPSESVVSAS